MEVAPEVHEAPDEVESEEEVDHTPAEVPEAAVQTEAPVEEHIQEASADEAAGGGQTANMDTQPTAVPDAAPQGHASEDSETSMDVAAPSALEDLTQMVNVSPEPPADAPTTLPDEPSTTHQAQASTPAPSHSPEPETVSCPILM